MHEGELLVSELAPQGVGPADLGQGFGQVCDATLAVFDGAGSARQLGDFALSLGDALLERGDEAFYELRTPEFAAECVCRPS